MADHPALKDFKCCPSCASTRIQRLHGKCVKCLDCSFEFFLNAAAAVGVLVSGPDGRIVLLRRAKEPGRGKLGIPGGFVDAMESFETAARREVLEETGLVLPERLEYLCSSFNRYEYAGVAYASSDVYFHARLDSFEGVAPLDETDAVALLRPDEVDLAELAFESGRQAIAALKAKCEPAASSRH